MCVYRSLNRVHNNTTQNSPVILPLKQMHTHTRLTALFSGLPRWASIKKVKPIRILLKQETVSGSGISWAICKSASRSRQTTMPATHHSVFLQTRCPSCHPTNRIKALKVPLKHTYAKKIEIMSRKVCHKSQLDFNQFPNVKKTLETYKLLQLHNYRIYAHLGSVLHVTSQGKN